VYALETPEGLEGDFTVVDMSGVNVDTPHYHTDGEREGHIPLLGSAVMSVGQEVIDMQPSMSVLVDPGTPHFIAPHPEDGYVVGVVSVPGYDPERQIPVDLENPPAGFNEDLYMEKLLGFEPPAGPEPGM
jgi:mannose-6-phosphate isomerase-like protein (cupin superfamily)